MVEDNKSTKGPGNPTGSSPSSLETKIKSLETKIKSFCTVTTLLILEGFAASAVGGYALARKTQKPIYKEITVPVQSSIADEKEVEERIRQEYQPQLDAAKEVQAKYGECMTNLTFEKAKPVEVQEATTESYYDMIKKNAGSSSSALLSYVRNVGPVLAGNLKIEGTNCDDGLSNLYTLMVSPQEAADKAVRKSFIDNNRNACGDITRWDQYIIVTIIEE